MASKDAQKPAKAADKPLLSILIPVYNEEKTIREILDKVAKLPIENFEILVIDDASKDGSKAMINDFQREFRAPNVKLKVLSHAQNRGKGAGIKTGLEHAQGRYFIIQDADLEYNPADITPLLAAAVEGDRPVVYGSRFLGEAQGMPRANYYANRFYNFLLRRLYDTSITDMHTCYKMVDTETLRGLGMVSEGFDYATELVSKLLRNNVSIHEVPISFKGRTRKQGKKIGIRDGIDCMFMIFKYRLGSKA